MLTDTYAFSGFSVRDQAEARTFYQDILGMNVVETSMGLELHLVGGGMVFLYQKEDHQPATFTVLNFDVTDIDGTIDSLVEKGVVFERYEDMPATQDERGVLRGKAANQGPDIAWFKDPSGNILSLLSN